MPKVCLYFHLHQPDRLRNYSIFDLDSHQYFADENADENKIIFQKVAQKSYWPMLSLLYELILQYPRTFFFSLSLTGTFLEQVQRYEPGLLSLLQKIMRTGNVEILAETYYHSLASLYSPKEFKRQVDAHIHKVEELFDFSPTSFRNTELIYSDWIGEQIAAMGFAGTITEAVDRYLHGHSRTQLFASNTSKKIPLLLKHAHLSDDIAFRFSESHRSGQPLTAETFVHWVNAYSEQEYVNLFMDFETFGEHQWADTGIFEFFKHFVKLFQSYDWNQFVRPQEVFAQADVSQLPVYYVPEPISWADIDRSITAWRDNDLQYDTLRLVYALEKPVLATKNAELIDNWRRLQTSDHFYYMCIKWSNDGDVHAYFSPYDSPFESYRRYTTVLADLQSQVTQLSRKVYETS